MRTIHFHTRWPAHQISENVIAVEIPESPSGYPVVNPSFSAAMRLTDAEQDKAEFAALRALAVLDS